MPDGLMTEEFKQYVSAPAKYCRDETFHGEYDWYMPELVQKTTAVSNSEASTIKAEG